MEKWKGRVIDLGESAESIGGRIQENRKEKANLTRETNDRQETLDNLRRCLRDTNAALESLQCDLQDVLHVKAGMCARLIVKGDAWYPSYERCTNKAKVPTRFCGVHRKDAEAEKE